MKTAPTIPVCKTLFKWLEHNFGRHVLGALTGTDTRALRAAAHIIELYAVDSDASALKAFYVVVVRMQLTTRELAYHAIAHALDWDDRQRIWRLAGLPELPAPMRAKEEPTPHHLLGDHPGPGLQ